MTVKSFYLYNYRRRHVRGILQDAPKSNIHYQIIKNQIKWY